MRAHPNISWRHVINQSKRAHGMDLLNFDNKLTKPLQVTGRRDAMKTLGFTSKQIEKAIDPDETEKQESWLDKFLDKFSILAKGGNINNS